MEIDEQEIIEFFATSLGEDGLSVVVPIEPEFWLHPLLPKEETQIHIPYGFRAPIESEKMRLEVVDTADDFGNYTLLCPKLIIRSLAQQPADIGIPYLDAWLHHLLYHLILGNYVEGDLEAMVDDLLYEEGSPTLNLMTRVQMYQLDRLSTG